jgi:hypothetical protein
MSDQNWQPGQPLPLGLTEINPYKTPTYSPNAGGGYDRTGRTRNRNRTGSDLFSQLSHQDIADINEATIISQTIQKIEASKATIANEHHIKSTQLAATLQSEIITVTANLGGVHGITPVEALIRQQTALTYLIHKKTLEQNSNQARANAFYGSDPLARTQQDLVDTYLRLPAAEVLHRWTDSYTTAYTAQRNAEELRQLTHRLHVLSYQLTQAYQAEEKRAARLQAQAAAQVAAQVARAKAEAENAAKVAAQIAQAKAEAEYANKVAAQIAQAEQEAREDALWEEKQKEAKQRKAEQNAERRRKQIVASIVASEFDSKLSQFSQNRPEGIDEKLRWIKDQYQALHAAYLAVSKAENEVGGFYRVPGRENRWNALNNAQNEIKALIRLKHKIEKVQIPPASGAIIAARPLVITPDGLIAGFEGSPFSLSNALSTLSSLRTAITSGPISTFLALVFYSPSLGNGEIQRNPIVLTIPLAQLDPNKNHKRIGRPATLYGISSRVTSSIRGDHTQLILESTDYSFPVRVRQAVLDSTTNQYTFTTEGLVPITLTWTPKSPPGVANSSSTELPVTESRIRIYPGARVTQVDARLDEHPVCSHEDPDDYILEFPIESGIESIYMMATRGGPRYEPGTATGKGQEVGENWLAGAAQSSGSPVPAQIADQLRGQEFRNFDKFREKFWRSVAADPKLSKQFSKADLKLLTNGAAPSTDEVDSVGRRDKYEIHHIEHIKNGGEVYNIDNLTVMTPSAHIKLHKNGIRP